MASVERIICPVTGVECEFPFFCNPSVPGNNTCMLGDIQGENMPLNEEKGEDGNGVKKLNK